MKSINEIAPLWAAKLEKDDYSAQTLKLEDGSSMLLNIASPSYCVVGEAYDFDNRYNVSVNHKYCDTCSELACDFLTLYMMVGGNYKSESLVKRYKTEDYKPTKDNLIKEFVEHWNEKHDVSN